MVQGRIPLRQTEKTYCEYCKISIGTRYYNNGHQDNNTHLKFKLRHNMNEYMSYNSCVQIRLRQKEKERKELIII